MDRPCRPLQLEGKPVTRVENYCTTGSEALRAAAYAVASGAYDMAMAVGAEKVKDTGYQGLNANNPPERRDGRTLTAAAMFSMVAPAYAPSTASTRTRSPTSWPPSRPRTTTTGPATPGPSSAARCPRRPSAPRPGWPAARRLRLRRGGRRLRRRHRRPGRGRPRYTDKPLYIKALGFATGSGSGLIDPGYDYTHFPECELAAADAYAQAGITDPRRQLAFAEVHDCFTPTELVLMEDLGFAERGTAWKEVLAGTFALDGELPVNPDGGLKSFGHPVGASGLRMFFECWLQLRGEATPERQITTDRTLALTHNLGATRARWSPSSQWLAQSRADRQSPVMASLRAARHGRPVRIGPRRHR